MNSIGVSAMPDDLKAVLQLLGSVARKRKRHDHLVMPEALRAHLAADGFGMCTVSPDVESVDPDCRAIFVFDPTLEPELVRTARTRFPQSRVISVQGELIPTLAAGGRLFGEQPDVDCERLTKYAVVCAPRTGSTFLCDALAQSGAGAPMEHLRAPLAFVLRNGLVEPESVYRRIVQQAARGGVFGTKLISNFLAGAFGPEGIAPFFAYLAAQRFSLIFLSRPLIEQAVSRYCAAFTRVYHVHGELSGASRELFEKIPYDFQKLCATFDRLAREESLLRSALASLDARHVRTVYFQDLATDPAATVRDCLQFIGLPSGNIQVQANTVHVSRSVGPMRSMAAQFEHDLARRVRKLARVATPDGAGKMSDPVTG